MPRPEKNWVTFEIDGREARAPEGSMLVDAAKHGDVEIPVFCYEPKLGHPVGACRMCLVEVEGIPKLQTGCSTPVQEGMVVSTLSDRVKAAQEAVVEFLLVNHPLDCPVCDKGGECPLQDITMGWGPGRSRFIEPKRHFKKPIELSPLVAIDRERCILCYRCVRFSQEVSEDYQLVFLERGDHTFVGTHDGHPYVGPFSGNIIELCPVGALTSTAYRFRARPWDVEEAGSICTMCPSQCNVQFTVRDDSRVLRVMARDNEDVDDGWLCDRGRFGYQAIHSEDRITQPLLNEGGSLRPVSWAKALEAAASGLKRAGAASAALVGGEASNEEGFLAQRLMRDALGSPHVDSRAGGSLDARHARALAAPDLSVPVWDVDNAGAILIVDTELVDEAPIVDLRVRKAARRSGAKVVVATSRPGTLDPSADAVVRFAPGAVEAALAALAAAGGVSPEGHTPRSGDGDDLARRAGADAGAVREAAALLRGSGPVVVIWGERISHGERGRQAVAALLALARALGLAAMPGAGLLEIPVGTNGRGLREVGCLPNLGPGLADAPEAGRAAPDVARGLADGRLSALVLLHADPLRTHPDRATWEAALDRATTVVCFSDFVTESARHADVVFPAEAYAEKDGTVTHPDGRLQRLRQAIGRPGEVRSGRQVLADLCDLLGAEAAPDVSAQLFDAVPFYAGLTLEEIGGRGVRWQERDAASQAPAAEPAEEQLETPPEPAGGLRLGTQRSLWAGREAEHAPALRFLSPAQRAELAPEDAQRLGIAAGDRVVVAVNGTSVQATAALRAAMPPGSVFLVEGTAEENPNVLTERSVEVRRA